MFFRQTKTFVIFLKQKIQNAYFLLQIDVKQFSETKRISGLVNLSVNASKGLLRGEMW